MGNACNFATDDEEMHFEKQQNNNRVFAGSAGYRSESHSMHDYTSVDGQSTLMPKRNPLRMEEIEQEMLSDEPGLIYVHELAYSNGAVYRGQIKSVDKIKKERADLLS